MPCRCEGEDNPLVPVRYLVEKSNGHTEVRDVCPECYQTVATLKKDYLSSRLPRITIAELAERRSAFWQEQWDARQLARQQEHEEWIDEYNEYLDSEEWKALREKVIHRCGGWCEGCLDRPVESVHHLTYEHVFNEFIFELVGLCHSCHMRLHPDKESEFTKNVDFSGLLRFRHGS